MSLPAAGNPLAVCLQDQREALIMRITARIHAEIPDYATASPALVRTRYTAIVDAMSRSLTTHNPSHLTSLLEQAARERLAQGYTIDALLMAADIVQQEFIVTITHELTADPGLEATTTRRVNNLVGTSRHVMSRFHLDAVMKQGPGTKQATDQAGD